jgi:hypothetical protein
MTIILYFSDTASQSSVMNYCTTVATFSLSLLSELGHVLIELFFEFSVVADAVAMGAAPSFLFSAPPVVAVPESLGAM